MAQISQDVPEEPATEPHESNVVISLVACVASVSCLSIYTTQHAPMREMSTQVSTINNMVFNLVNAISAHLRGAQFCLFHL